MHLFFFAGSGFLTVHLKSVTFNTKSDHDIDFESKVKLYIDNKEVFVTAARQNMPSHKINATYKSDKIPKDSKIRVRVSAISPPYESVVEHQYTIKSLLENPILNSKNTGHLTLNTLEMEASWQDEN